MKMGQTNPQAHQAVAVLLDGSTDVLRSDGMRGITKTGALRLRLRLERDADNQFERFDINLHAAAEA